MIKTVATSMSHRFKSFNYKTVLVYSFISLFILAQFVLVRRIYIKKASQSLNLILISVDTLRADHMGIYGYPKNTTPNIDAWAKDETVFTNAYTIMPITFHSFYTLFTGKDDVLKNEVMANRYVNVDKISDKILTLPKILKENNFRTGAFITNPVIGDPNLNFFSGGFQDFEYVNTSGIHNNDKLPEINVYSHDFENDKEVTKRGEEWIEANKDNRFFLWLHYTTPHMPYNPQKEYLCEVDKDCNKEIYNTLISDLSTTEDGVLKSCTDDEPSPEVIKESKNLYDAEILSVDKQVGRVLNELKHLNLSQKTVVIFYGDHGEGFDHNIFSHGDSLYQSAIRIPLIIKIPFEPPRTITHLMDNSDILPTTLDVLKIQYDKKQIDGRSLAPALYGQISSSNRKYIYSIATTEKINKLSIFDGTYKYIQSITDYCINDNEREELYNLKADPQESEDLVSKNKEIKNKLRDQLMNSGVVIENTIKSESKIIDRLRSLGF